MEVEFDDDIIQNLVILYGLSCDVDFTKHPVKKVPMTRSDALALNYDFFKSLKSTKNTWFLKAIENYNNKIYESDIVEGGVYGIENKVKKIIAPRLDNVYGGSILTHEITHALEFEKKVNIRKTDLYQEIVPFLNQFLFIEYLKKYYYVDELRESNVDFMVNNQLLYNVHEYGNSSDGIEVDVPKAREHLKYIYGSLYSLVLYDWYQADEDFMKVYSKIYTSGKTIEDVLKHYDVSFGDISNVILVRSLMKK